MLYLREEEEKKVIQEKRRRHQDHILTTGCNLRGYKIIEYKGLVGGEITLGTGIISAISSEIADFSGGESNTYTKKIESAKKLATNRMIEASVEADGNAIIAIDINVFNKDIIGVSVNGTSVVIEKIDL